MVNTDPKTGKPIVSGDTTSASSMSATSSTRVKDMSVSNLIEPWNGEGPISVSEFFAKIERAAKTGNWLDSDKVTVAVLKFTGAAALFYNSNVEVASEDITFDRLKEIFTERFKMKHLDQFHYSQLQNATQRKSETPEQFADLSLIHI